MQTVALDCTFLRNLFAKLAIAYVFTTLLDIALAVLVPPADLERKYIWPVYFMAMIASWTFSLIIRCGLNNPYMTTKLPHLCFVSNNVDVYVLGSK